MWIPTPPWLLFSLRGRRKRCQHDPGSRLWRGSGRKSKTLSFSSPHIGVSLSQIFTYWVSGQELSHVQRHAERHAHRWFLFTRTHCLSRGNKDDKGPLWVASWVSCASICKLRMLLFWENIIVTPFLLRVCWEVKKKKKKRISKCEYFHTFMTAFLEFLTQLLK